MDNAKKDAMLTAGLKEFAEKGYENANTNEICKNAEVSKGLLFHYYGSKQKLYLAVFEKCTNDILSFFNSISVVEADFTSAILKYYKYRMSFFTEHPDHYKMLMQTINNPPKDIKADLDIKIAEVNHLAQGVLYVQFEKLPLKEGVKQDTALKLIIGALNMIEGMYGSMLYNGKAASTEQYDSMEKESRELLRLALYGIAYEAK